MKLFLSILMLILPCSSYSFEIEQEMTCEFLKNFKATAQKQPVLILIGGFSGSGKSSLAKQIQEIYDIHVISTDAIRQKLLNKGVKVSDLSKYVSTIYKNIMEHCLLKNSHICIDANAHSKRIRQIKELLQEDYSQYSVVKIFLDAPLETLRKRVREREPMQDYYNGTESELEASFASIIINYKEYDLILDTEKLNQNSVFHQVNSFLPESLKVNCALYDRTVND